MIHQIVLLERIDTDPKYPKMIALIDGREFTRDYDEPYYNWDSPDGWGHWFCYKDDSPHSDFDVVCACGNDSFRISYPQAYTTVATCNVCGRSDSVHEG